MRPLHSLSSRRLALPAALALLLCAAPVLAAVAPPPLPPGSNLVRVEGGLDRAERKREARAHHHKLHHRKDMTRDDSVYGNADEDDGKGKDKDPKTPKGNK